MAENKSRSGQTTASSTNKNTQRTQQSANGVSSPSNTVSEPSSPRLKYLESRYRDLQTSSERDKRSLCPRIKTITDIRVFVWLYAAILLVRCGMSQYIPYMMDHVQRHYFMSVMELRFLTGADKIGFAITLLFIAYYGNNLHKPLAIMVGSLVCSVASVLCTLPYILDDDDDVQSWSSNHTDADASKTPLVPQYYDVGLCQIGRNSSSSLTQCEVLKFHSDTNEAFSLLAIGLFLIGVGTSLMATLGFIYIEESSEKTKAGSRHGIVLCLCAVGELIGLVAAWQFMLLPKDVPEVRPVLTEWDVGSWWLGFPIAAVILFFLPLPLILFPKWIIEPQWLLIRYKRKKDQYLKQIKDEKKKIEKVAKRKAQIARKKAKQKQDAKNKKKQNGEASKHNSNKDNAAAGHSHKEHDNAGMKARDGTEQEHDDKDATINNKPGTSDDKDATINNKPGTSGSTTNNGPISHRDNENGQIDGGEINQKVKVEQTSTNHSSPKGHNNPAYEEDATADTNTSDKDDDDDDKSDDSNQSTDEEKTKSDYEERVDDENNMTDNNITTSHTTDKNSQTDTVKPHQVTFSLTNGADVEASDTRHHGNEDIRHHCNEDTAPSSDPQISEPDPTKEVTNSTQNDKNQRKHYKLGRRLKDLPRNMWFLITRPIFIVTLAMTVISAYSVMGYQATLHNYIDAVFPVYDPPSAVLANVPYAIGSAVGVFVAVLVLYERPVSLIVHVKALLIIQGALVVLYLLTMAPFCPNQMTSNMTTFEFNDECSRQCDCSGAQYNQICSKDGQMFPSPCHAGCRDVRLDGKALVYSRCTCVAAGVDLSSVLCKSCSSARVGYLILVFVISVIRGAGYISLLTIYLRSVSQKLRSLALGFAVWITHLASIPGPAVYHAFRDSVCILGRPDCIEDPRCWHSDVSAYRYLQNAVTALFHLVALGLSLVLYAVVKNRMAKEAAMDKETGKNTDDSRPNQDTDIIGIDNVTDNTRV